MSVVSTNLLYPRLTESSFAALDNYAQKNLTDKTESSSSDVINSIRIKKSEDKSLLPFSKNHIKAKEAYLHSNKTNALSSLITKSEETEDNKEKKQDVTEKKRANGEPLSEKDQKKIDELKKRYEEVRIHEMAHKNAGGSYASSPIYEYTQGPDGKRYATDGHVNIDISEDKTPEKTIKKMQQVITAANAPAEPSSADRNVAAQAREKMMEARRELLNSTYKESDHNENLSSKLNIIA